jgi:hypothetical protein
MTNLFDSVKEVDTLGDLTSLTVRTFFGLFPFPAKSNQILELAA